MNVILRTNQADLCLALNAVQRFGDNSGYRAMLEVRSRGYQVRAPFSFEPSPLDQFILQLENMDRNLKGTARLKPMFEDHFIELTITNTGRVIVHGEIYDYSEHPQHLAFAFETDQTVLTPLIRDLKACRALAAA